MGPTRQQQSEEYPCEGKQPSRLGYAKVCHEKVAGKPLAAHRLAESRARREDGRFARSNLKGFASSWITPSPGRALGDAEGTKSWECDIFPTLERVLYGLHKRVKKLFCHFLGCSCPRRNILNKIALSHLQYLHL